MELGSTPIQQHSYCSVVTREIVRRHTCLHQNRASTGCSIFELLLCQQERRVAVLRCVRVKVEPRHQHDTIDAKPPFLGQHLLTLPPESASPALLMQLRMFLLMFAGCDELWGLGEESTNQTDTDREAGTDPEDSFPGIGTATDTEVATGGDHIAEGIALLKDTGHKTSSVCWAIFKSHSDCRAVDTAHKEAEEGSNSQERSERGRVDRCNLKEAEDDHIGHKRPFAA